MRKAVVPSNPLASHPSGVGGRGLRCVPRINMCVTLYCVVRLPAQATMKIDGKSKPKEFSVSLDLGCFLSIVERASGALYHVGGGQTRPKLRVNQADGSGRLEGGSRADGSKNEGT